MQLPAPRGPISSFVIETLRSRPPGKLHSIEIDDDPLIGDDFHLGLYLLYELHYTAIDGVDPDWEWDPALLAFRAELERRFQSALQQVVPHGEGRAADIIDKLLEAIASDESPSVSRYLETDATREEFLEFVMQRSAYQLKEADPHTWVIPRLNGAAKAAIVEIQSDEYGGGRADRIHSVLFAKTMEALDLDADYGAYVDRLPGVTLAGVNLLSMFALHRKLRGAAVGHLATFETMSSEPNGRYARGLRRLGFTAAATDFFDEHVEADAVHEVIAIHDLVGGLVADEPNLAPDVLWGARCLLALDKLWAEQLLGAWKEGTSSLLEANVVARPA